MVGIAAAVGLVVLVGLHTLVAAVATRLLRVRLASRWAPVVFALALVPLLLVASMLVVTGSLGLGPDLGSPGMALFVLVAVPLGLGLAVDYLWMPAPEDVELPVPQER
jgi:hypothetical protein